LFYNRFLDAHRVSKQAPHAASADYAFVTPPFLITQGVPVHSTPGRLIL